MTPERYQEVGQLYRAALEVEPERREAFLVEACSGDEMLRQEVESLLSFAKQSGGLIDQPALDVAAKTIAEDQPWSPVGQSLGHYRILSLLGKGGMGEVYCARDTKLDRTVALKLLPAELAANQDRMRRFVREAKAASALNHPHVATIYEIGEAKGVSFIAMEYVEGQTLAAEINGRPLDVSKVIEIGAQVADALDEAHSKGITHRDIKPANLMLTPRGRVKVLDFGLAKVAHPAGQDELSQVNTQSQTTPGVVMGTVAYMSPEQALGREVDHRSDIFSLGVALYEMATGQRPFRGATASETIDHILHTEPEAITQINEQAPAGLAQVVSKCLAKEREQRYQSARDLLTDLDQLKSGSLSAPRGLPTADEAFATEEATTKRLKTARTPPNQVPERSRWRRWGVGACVTAAFLLIAMVILWRLRESDYFWQNPLAGARVERLTDFEGDEVNAAISPDGKFITFLSDRDGQFDAWVSQIGSGDFVNLTKGRFPTIEPGVIRKVGFSGDGAQVWIQEGLGSGPYKVWLASVMGGAHHPFLPGGMEPEWSPDGSKIVYHTLGGDPIFIADRTGSNPSRVYAEKPEGHCHYLTWSPDSRFIYFVKGSPTTEELDIWRIPVATNGAPAEPERITHHNARVAYPAWLDARTMIYSATAEDGSGQWLYTLDVERRIPHRVSSGITEQYLSVAVSTTLPRRLIASVAVPSVSLWTVTVSDHIQTEEGGARFAVPNTRALGPRFASDYLLFLSSRGGGDGIWKLEKGSARELWKGSEGGVVAPPAISPDGSQICFSYRKHGREGLYLMNGDGTNIRSLAETLDVRGAAAWSPDGKWITVAANQNEGTRVFKVPVDGGPSVRLLDTPSYNPIWSLDGRFIIYSEPLQGSAFLVKAITPDKAPIPMPDIQVPYTLAAPYRFAPGRKALIFIKDGAFRARNFFWVDLETGKERQLTDLKPGFLIQSFDVSPDGKQIIFDRLRENSDIVMMYLPR